MTKNKRRKTGLPPGSLVFTGRQFVSEPHVNLLQYNEEEVHEQEQKDQMLLPREGPFLKWYDIRGLHNADLISQFGDSYGIHPLVLEDILNTQQRPKIEEHENGVFFTAQALRLENGQIDSEQISLFFGEKFLISFQEKEIDNFALVRTRIHAPQARIRRRGVDYLAYALLDTLVDFHYPILDQIEERIEALETSILSNPGHTTKSQIHQLKRQLLTLRRSIVPLREAVNRFSRNDSPFVKDETEIFIRDLHDHTVQILDSIETYRDMVNGLYDLYLSEIGFRTNAVMKVLTVISTIFIPLTFIAGIYGMNFANMPELGWKYGYFAVLGLMLVLALGSLSYFKRKKWL